jgi:hypothetical protein
MESEYGSKKGKQVFYASENKGTVKGVKLSAADRDRQEKVGDELADMAGCKRK